MGANIARAVVPLQKQRLEGVIRSKRGGQIVRCTLLKVKQLEPLLRYSRGVNY